jgi:hypothetical protein
MKKRTCIIKSPDIRKPINEKQFDMSKLRGSALLCDTGNNIANIQPSILSINNKDITNIQPSILSINENNKDITNSQQSNLFINKKSIDTKHRALILITERNRMHQQKIFIPVLTNYLKSKNIKYTMYVMHQNNNKLFNKAALYNIGYKMACDDRIEFDYVIMHDIDMLVNNDYDYSYVNGATHLAGTVINYNLDGDLVSNGSIAFMGGITIIDRISYKNINGYSNKYEGWGFEDSSFRTRIDNTTMKQYVRTGVFTSWPNPRVSSNPVYNINEDLYYKNKPTDGLNDLVQVDNIINKSIINDIFEYTVINSYKDIEFDDVEHRYVDFLSQYTKTVIVNK